MATASKTAQPAGKGTQPKLARNYLHIAATCLAVIFVAYGLVQANRREDLKALSGGMAHMVVVYSEGWPWDAREVIESRGGFPARRLNTKEIEWYWSGVAVDSLTAMLMLAATAACGMRWRGRIGLQITLRGLFVLLTIVAVLIAIYQQSVFFLLPWRVIAPLMLGIAAVVYWICWGVIEGASRLIGVRERQRK